MTSQQHTELVDALERAGVRFHDLVSSAECIVLYGSRAAGCWVDSSDWDILCVGTGESMWTGTVDITWVSPSRVYDPEWLSSELATHVARYGVVIHGSAPWMTTGTTPSRAAAMRKLRGICVDTAALASIWDILGDDIRVDRVRDIYRDIRRFELLYSGIAVPPTAMLCPTCRIR